MKQSLPVLKHALFLLFILLSVFLYVRYTKMRGNDKRMKIDSTRMTEDEPYQRLTVLMKEERLFTHGDIKRRDIAMQIGISDRALHDCLKNNTGMSFTEYINHLRLAYARELMLRPKQRMTIETIAMESGFNSRITFWRLFRKKYGLSPEKFLESHDI